MKKEECARESPRTGIRESRTGRGRMIFFREIRGGVVRDSVHYTRTLSLKSFSFQEFGISFFPEVSSNTSIIESQYEIIFK
jgi:hypothetical protein